MDHRPKNRGPSGPMAPKKAQAAAQNASICNRTGCSGRIKNVQVPRIGCSDKHKCANPSSRSSIGNEITRKPSKSSSFMTTSARKPYLDSKQTPTSQAKSDLSESRPPSYDNPSPSSNVRPRKITTHHNKSRSNDQNSPPTHSVPSASRSSASGPLSSTMMRRRGLEREGGSSSRERKTTNRSPMNRPMATGFPDFRNRRNRSSVVISEFPTSESLPSIGRRNSSMSFSSSGSASFASGGNGEGSYDTMDFASEEHGFMHLMGHDDMLRGYNMGGVIEILLALERIEQDQELTHEDLLGLEASLFLGSLSLYDRHRDMRLDIDNMSYEELLALEEKIGNVTTALSEDALSKCLKKSICEGVPPEVDNEGDDIKCSICQEEYVGGDEIGSLVECQHGYHLVCINQWLQLKNWCPVCKASAGPSQVS